MRAKNFTHRNFFDLCRANKELGNVNLELRQQCQKRDELITELDKRLQDGRHYLMGVEPKKLTVEDALEAFGFGRNGLTFNSEIK